MPVYTPDIQFNSLGERKMIDPTAIESSYYALIPIVPKLLLWFGHFGAVRR